MHPARALIGVAFATALIAAGCGDGGGGASSEAPSTAAQQDGGGMQHIHGLGVRGETVYVATHTGLWAAREGQTTPTPVGPSRQDVMGFSILDTGRFIGSGHPAPGQDMPPNLGLIESGDKGKTWTSVSLLGEADFHALASQGARVYGFDGTQGRLMVSSDGGRSWDERTPPAAIFGLAIDPKDADTIIASTEKGTFMSPDAARGWRPLNPELVGLVAWPTADRLYLIDGNGAVQVSADAGRQWRNVGSIDGQPAAFIAGDGGLYAALSDATVKRSSDGGRSWTVRAAP